VTTPMGRFKGRAGSPPTLRYECCRGDACNKVAPSSGACFVGDPAVRASGANASSPFNASSFNASNASAAGAVPFGTQVPSMLNSAVGCEVVPGAVSGTCVVVRQEVLGTQMTTGMCYSDVHGAAFSSRDWMGIQLNCSAKPSGELLMFDGAYQPKLVPGDPIRNLSFDRVSRAARVSYRCCTGSLCNEEAMPASLLLPTHAIRATIAIYGIVSPEVLLATGARALRSAIAVGITVGLRPSDANAHPVVLDADVALTALCQGERCVGLFSEVARAVANRSSLSQQQQSTEEEGTEALPVALEFQVAAGLEDRRGQSPEEIIRAMGNSTFLPSLSLALRAATGSTTQRAGMYIFKPHLLNNVTSSAARPGPTPTAVWAAAGAFLLLVAHRRCA